MPITVLIDTGASINILNFKTFEKINNFFKRPLCLHKSKTQIITYGNNNPKLKNRTTDQRSYRKSKDILSDHIPLDQNAPQKSIIGK